MLFDDDAEGVCVEEPEPVIVPLLVDVLVAIAVDVPV